MRRASWEDAELVEDCIYRDFARRNGAMEQFLADRMNVCLLDGNGGALFVWRGPGIYETHCFFEQRGKEVREVSQEMLRIMREEHGARLIWAAIPDESRKVKIYVRWLGFKSVEKREVTNIGMAELFTLEM
jgi:predicted small metal-binding protein